MAKRARMLKAPAQLALWDRVLPRVPLLGESLAAADALLLHRDLERRFWRFHRACPEVYAELVRLARQLHRRGFARYGIGSLWEVLRWRRDIRLGAEERAGTGGVELFRINNDYRSRYARLIMLKEPDLRGFFELRMLKTESNLLYLPDREPQLQRRTGEG